jgi:signal transduction histidine kinase
MLGNLLENACQWASSRVLVTVEPQAPLVNILIEDDGPGIAPEQRARVLQRGGRLDESRPGTGLGLAIAAELVERHGGTLQLQDSLLGGLRVALTLPMANPRRSI